MWPKILGYEFGQGVPPFMWPNKFCNSLNFANWFDLVIVTITFLIVTNLYITKNLRVALNVATLTLSYVSSHVIPILFFEFLIQF